MNLGTPNQNDRNIVVAGEGVIFVHNPTATGSDDWLRYASAEDGKLRWEVQFKGNVNSMVVDKDRVYTVGLQKTHRVTAYDLKTGTLIWVSEANLPGHTGYYIRFQAKKLYVYSSASEIYVFDPESGDLLDTYNAALNHGSIVLLQLDNGNALQYDNKNLLLTMNKEILWQTEHQAFVLYKFPRVYDNLVIIQFEERTGIFDGIMAVNLNTGEIIWRRSGEFSSNFIIIDDLLYVISGDAKILTLDPSNGKTLGFLQVLPANVANQTHRNTGIAGNSDMLYVYFEDSQELIAFGKKRE
jgi:outer membrane protein assembly factor BamB